METKLTLKLDKNIIVQAKKYAKQRNVSLSKMVERYFKSLTDEKQQDDEKNTKLVNELSGIINVNEIADLRDDYTDHLIEKYK